MPLLIHSVAATRQQQSDFSNNNQQPGRTDGQGCSLQWLSPLTPQTFQQVEFELANDQATEQEGLAEEDDDLEDDNLEDNLELPDLEPSPHIAEAGLPKHIFLDVLTDQDFAEVIVSLNEGTMPAIISREDLKRFLVERFDETIRLEGEIRRERMEKRTREEIERKESVNESDDDELKKWERRIFALDRGIAQT
ncbi:hypothetical protein CC78DRAFT_529933 [Lojkania enalia]|uniref:Uncharacterized protein n=1 Tax=Lojkania enalia TaxID=147567 RepID=A0A9P4KGY5_9PLEO|nr:hypothetical protein CC78DRAFT_529933 [Didymosphaeria enalia]